MGESVGTRSRFAVNLLVDRKLETQGFDGNCEDVHESPRLCLTSLRFIGYSCMIDYHARFRTNLLAACISKEASP